MRRPRFPLGVFLLGIAAVGCQQHWPTEERSSREQAAGGAQESELAPREGRLPAALAAAKARLEQSLEAPATQERIRCPDETLGSGAAETLLVRARDARSERKSPLPLRLVASLESDEFSPILAHLSGGAAALWEPSQAKPLGAEAGNAALAEIGKLSARPYLAELRIEDYSEPRLFRRKDAPRSEWAAGLVSGRLVVFDLDTKRPICQAPVFVRGDATGAPIRKRLREMTRERLRQELQDRAWSAMQSALASITSRLVLPPNSRRNDSAQRWAAAREELPRKTPGS